MDVLLLKNIKNLGDIGSNVSVKSGYARNYLLPNNLAVLSSKENLAIVEEKKQLLLKQEEELRNQAINIKEKFNDYILTFDVHVQEDDDKLFGSINLQNIVEKLNNDGYELEKKQVNLPSGPIKIFADDYIATVSLYADVSVTIPIKLTKIAKPSPENTSENPSSESPE
jgi:ribosomal protein L9